MGARALPVGALGGLTSPAQGLVERLRRVHQEMVEATLSGDGLERVAALAAAQVAREVVIVVP